MHIIYINIYIYTYIEFSLVDSRNLDFVYWYDANTDYIMI